MNDNCQEIAIERKTVDIGEMVHKERRQVNRKVVNHDDCSVP